MLASKIVVFAFLLILGACGGEVPEQSPTPREVYDVPPIIEIPIADDPQEVPRPKGLSGRLPAGFPETLPLFLPASLIDYGLDEAPWIEILCPAEVGRVESEMLSAARQTGWSVEGDSLSLGERRVRLDFRSANPGTIVRIFY